MEKLPKFSSTASSSKRSILMLAYPLYATIRAIESRSMRDVEQWLSYWILYSLLKLFDVVAEPILDWVPVWYDIELMLMAWLMLPQFRGAAFIYRKFVRVQLCKFMGGATSRPFNTPSGKDRLSNASIASVTLRKIMKYEVETALTNTKT